MPRYIRPPALRDWLALIGRRLGIHRPAKDT